MMKTRNQPRRRLPVAQSAARPRARFGADWPWRSIALAGILVAMALVTYTPVLNDGFIWDDDAYVTRNLTLRSVRGLGLMWFYPRSLPQWYPLVHTTFWIEFHLWGLDPLGYHVVNVLLHATSAVLFWRLLTRLRVPGAWLAAAIFAVHPVMVESVAWVTERKNALSLPLALAAMLCYLRFSAADENGRVEEAGDEAIGVDRRFWGWYGLALVFFLAALLSKTIVAPMPAVLLVIYWWKRGRLTWSDLWPLVPFFAIGAGLGIFTAHLERTHVGAEGSEWAFTLLERTLIAGRSIWFYATKLAWPYPTIFFYPRPEPDVSVWWHYVYPVGALGLVIVLWLGRRRFGRGPLAAALIFGGVLLPALGFLNVYPFRYSFVADHFQYHASLALVALAGAGMATLAARIVSAAGRVQPGPADVQGMRPPFPGRGPRVALAIAAMAILVTLGTLSFRQTFAYYDLDSIYKDVIAKNPQAWVAYSNLGVQYGKRGEKDEALAMFTEAVRIDPSQPKIHSNYAQALFDCGKRDGFAPGQLDEVIEQYKESLRLDPLWQPGMLGLGSAYIEAKEPTEARKYLERALELYPKDSACLLGMGFLLVQEKKWSEAQEFFEKAVKENPNVAKAHHGIGLCLLNQDKAQEAIPHLSTALALDADDFEAHYHMANALQIVGDLPTAIDQYNEAIRLKPDYPDALSNLGVTWGMRGDADKAIEYIERVIEIDPDFPGVQTNLASARELKQQQRDQAKSRGQ
jgi:tetratricopeptide (TPR) repeat protein